MTVMPRDVSEFSRKDATVYVYTVWQKKEKVGKGVLSAQVFDAQNRVRVNIEPKKVPLLDNAPTRVSFSFSPEKLERGHYRLDLSWEDRTVWRTFFSIVD
jgi:hypothetical protein